MILEMAESGRPEIADFLGAVRSLQDTRERTFVFSCLLQVSSTIEPKGAQRGIGEYSSGRDLGVAKRIDLQGDDALIVIGDVRDQGSFTDWAAIRILR